MTTENNKIIAKFMGGLKIYVNKNDLKFHSDWNWLMEVVEKIESLGASVEINNKLCIIEPTPIFNFEFHFSNLESTKFKAIYNACVDFINFYNQNK